MTGPREDDDRDFWVPNPDETEEALEQERGWVDPDPYDTKEKEDAEQELADTWWVEWADGTTEPMTPKTLIASDKYTWVSEVPGRRRGHWRRRNLGGRP